MGVEERIDIELFKVVSRSISASDDLELMAGQLTQLLTGALGIKGCSLFAFNPDSKELEILGSFGLSADYLYKGPILSEKSIARTVKGETVLVSDTETSDMLQYPEEAKKEGIRSIASLPVKHSGHVIGALRLYHPEPWKITVKDQDSLLLLAEIIGLAMMYARLRIALRVIDETVSDIHSIWLNP